MTLNRNLRLPNPIMKTNIKRSDSRKSKDGYSSEIDKTSATSRTFYEKLSTVDWPSLSDTGLSSTDLSVVDGDSNSNSSASSLFSWADSEATENLIEEWNKIERTLFDEEGPKVHSKILQEECDQWKIFFPHLRILGSGIPKGIIKSEQEIKNVIPSQLKKLKNYSFENNLQTIKHFEPMNRLNLSGCSASKTPRNIKNVPQICPSIHSPSAVHRFPGILQSEISSSRWRKQDGSILSPSFYTSQLSSYTNREKSSKSIYSEVNTPCTEKLRMRYTENVVLKEPKSAIDELKRTNKNKIHLPPISANSKNKRTINNNKCVDKQSDTLVPLDSKQSLSNIPICAKIQRRSSKVVDLFNKRSIPEPIQLAQPFYYKVDQN